MAVIAVLTNLPDSESAFNLARELVQLRLAACVNVLPAATSFYRWNSQIEQAAEVPVLIKSTRERYGELERAIRERHPYEPPRDHFLERSSQGLPDYLAWIESESRAA